MRSAPLWALVALACAAEVPEGDPGPEAAGPGGADRPAAIDSAEAPPPPVPMGTAESAAMEPWLDRYDFDDRLWYVDLPGRLDEVSGLAMSPDGRLFAHDDETGRIHEVDTSTGEVGKGFDLGDPVALDDFEGITIVGERFFVVSSLGLLYEFREGADRVSVEYRITDTGVGAACEVEGLEYDPEDDALLMACKTTVPARGPIVIERIPMRGGGVATRLEVERDGLRGWGVDRDFAPSGVVRTPVGTLLVLSARDDAIIEVDRLGTILSATRLSGGRHPQSEGIAIGPDGVLYVADEKNGKEPRLTAYAPTRADARAGTAGAAR